YVLEQVAARTRPDRLEKILFLVADRQHDDLRARRDLLHRAARLDAAAAWHPDIHQDNVGQRLTRLLDRLRPVACLTDELDVVLLGQDHLQAPAEEGMVIDDQRADWIETRGGVVGPVGNSGVCGHVASLPDPACVWRARQQGAAAPWPGVHVPCT